MNPYKKLAEHEKVLRTWKENSLLWEERALKAEAVIKRIKDAYTNAVMDDITFINLVGTVLKGLEKK